MSGSAANRKPKDSLFLANLRAEQDKTADNVHFTLQFTSTQKASFALRRVHTFRFCQISVLHALLYNYYLDTKTKVKATVFESVKSSCANHLPSGYPDRSFNHIPKFDDRSALQKHPEPEGVFNLTKFTNLGIEAIISGAGAGKLDPGKSLSNPCKSS